MLLYICVANLAKEYLKAGKELPEPIHHYYTESGGSRCNIPWKAGKQNRGYVANVTEAAGENGSIVLDYQYEQNVHSDSQFLQEALEAEAVHGESVIIVTDGAYAGGKNQELAKEKNIELVTTNLAGWETEDILGDFEYSGDGKK